MTMLTQEDVKQALSHEFQIKELHGREFRVRTGDRWIVTKLRLLTTHWVDVGVDAVIWLAVLAAASGAGLLLEAVVDTVRYGHPR
jgi:hypothetical protein